MDWIASVKNGPTLVSKSADASLHSLINSSILSGCDKSQISDDVKKCPAFDVQTSTVSPFLEHSPDEKSSRTASPVTQLEPERSSAGFFTTICSIFAIIFVGVCWVFYAYTHPHTSSGQFLIQYGRPSAWSWRRGEARYTAATIHMWSPAQASSVFLKIIILYLVDEPFYWYDDDNATWL